MDQAYLLQFVGSGIAVCLLAGAAWWARIPRPVQPLNAVSARALIAEELPDDTFDSVWIDAGGDAAVARAGEIGAVLFRVGDGYAVRTLPWTQVKAARPVKGAVIIPFHDMAAPRAAFRLASGQASAPFTEAAA